MRPTLVTVALLTAAILVWRRLLRFWLNVVVGWGTYHRTVEWLDPAMLLLWGLMAALWIACGVMVVIVARPRWPIVVATATAAAFSFVQIYGSHYYFTPNTEVSDYVWSYGLYAVAPLASLIAAVCAVWVRRRNAV